MVTSSLQRGIDTSKRSEELGKGDGLPESTLACCQRIIRIECLTSRPGALEVSSIIDPNGREKGRADLVNGLCKIGDGME